MTQHIDDVAVVVGVEEPPDPPLFVAERVNDLQADLYRDVVRGIDVVDLDGDGRIDCRRRIASHEAELVPVFGVGEGGNPAVIHDHLKAEDCPVLLNGQVEVIDCEDGYDAFNAHRSTIRTNSSRDEGPIRDHMDC